MEIAKISISIEELNATSLFVIARWERWPPEYIFMGFIICCRNTK